MLLWTLIAIYAGARVLPVFPGFLPMLAVVAFHVLPPGAFALLHGAAVYRARGIAIFSALCLGIGSASEIAGLRSGFPFGHYYFTGVMGPRFFGVPYLLALAYLGMGYVSWMLAQSILGKPAGWRMLAVPALAAAAMTAWDLSSDPVWSTIAHAWIWLDGGPYFGVPLSNFAGWYLTAFLYYLCFVFSVRGRKPCPGGNRAMPILLYAISAGGNLLLLVPPVRPAWVADPSGVQWRVADITAACALVSVLLMGAFAILAWRRMAA